MIPDKARHASNTKLSCFSTRCLGVKISFDPQIHSLLHTNISLSSSAPFRLLKKGVVKPMVEPPVPKVPMDYTWAKRLGLVRKPANFISSISDDRGDELR